MEKEYIDQRISGIAVKKIDNALERITKEMKIIGVMKRKAILGSFFKTIERDDADIVKIINKRIKLEKDKIAKEQDQRIKDEALENQGQTTDRVETENIRNNDEEKIEELQLKINSDLNNLSKAFEIVKLTSKSFDDLNEFGIKLVNKDVSLIDLKEEIEKELYDLSMAHFNRYFVEPIRKIK